MPPSPNRPLAEILTDLSTLLQIRQKLQQKDEAHLVLSLPWTDSLLLSTLTSLSDSLPSPSPPQALQNLHQMLDIEDTLNKMELHDMVNQLQIVMIQQKTCLESADKVNDVCSPFCCVFWEVETDRRSSSSRWKCRKRRRVSEGRRAWSWFRHAG